MSDSQKSGLPGEADLRIMPLFGGLTMLCSKCTFENSDSARFCNQRTATLLEKIQASQLVKTPNIANPSYRTDIFYKAGIWWAARDTSEKAVTLISTIALVSLIVVMLSMAINQESKKYIMPSNSPGTSTSPTPAKPAVVTSTQHLDSAKTFLAGIINRNDLEQAQEHLKQVSQGTMEYAEAQELYGR